MGGFWHEAARLSPLAPPLGIPPAGPMCRGMSGREAPALPPIARPPRRALPALAAAAWGALAPRAALAQPAGYRFRILREGREIGSHRVDFTREGERLVARSALDILVRMLGVTLFRMEHRQEEVWQGERLVRAAMRQDRNGTIQQVSAEAREGGVLVRGEAGEFRLPPEAAPLAWWDHRRPGRPVFDNANGKPLSIRWARRPQPDGGLDWRLTGEVEAEVGYAPDGLWRSVWITGEDGSRVIYQPA